MDTRTGEILQFENTKDLKKAIADQRRNDFGFLREIARPLTPLEFKEKKIGRNSPCGCGSGKKFKKCCWTGHRDSIPDDSIAEEMIQDQLDKY